MCSWPTVTTSAAVSRAASRLNAGRVVTSTPPRIRRRRRNERDVGPEAAVRIRVVLRVDEHAGQPAKQARRASAAARRGAGRRSPRPAPRAGNARNGLSRRRITLISSTPRPPPTRLGQVEARPHGPAEAVRVQQQHPQLRARRGGRAPAAAGAAPRPRARARPGGPPPPRRRAAAAGATRARRAGRAAVRRAAAGRSGSRGCPRR